MRDADCGSFAALSCWSCWPIIAILMSLLLVAVQYSRDAARRTHVPEQPPAAVDLRCARTRETAQATIPTLSPPDQAGGWADRADAVSGGARTCRMNSRFDPLRWARSVSPLTLASVPRFLLAQRLSMAIVRLAGIPASHYLVLDAARKSVEASSDFSGPSSMRCRRIAGPGLQAQKDLNGITFDGRAP